MKLSFNIIEDHLRNFKLESYVHGANGGKFCRAALLPRDIGIMKTDIIHVCRLSDALHVKEEVEGMHYLCVRDRIKDDAETEENLKGMLIVNENIDVEHLLNDIQMLFANINEWYQNLQDALISEKSLTYILNSCKDIIGNTINISDAAFTLLARTENITTDDEISVTLAEYGYHPKLTLDKFRSHHRIESWEGSETLLINDSLEISKYIMVNKVFRFKNTYFTHVVMVCDHRPLSDGLLEEFEMLTNILAIYSEKNWKDKNALSHNYDSFMVDMIEGNLTDALEIKKRASYLGLSIEGPFVLAVANVEMGMESTLGRIGRELNVLIPGAQVIIYEKTVVILMQVGKRAGQFDTYKEEIRKLFERYSAHAGMSNIFEKIEGMSQAHFQAVLALKYNNIKLHATDVLGDILPLPEQQTVCMFEQRFIHMIMAENKDCEKIWKSSHFFDNIKSLYDKDREHGTNNLQLLRTYLWCERKATETGQLMHMHRNNVIYRIDRIEKMFKINLDDLGTRVALQLSFFLIEYYGI